MNRNIARPRGLHLDVYRWETDSHPGFHPLGPQGLIDPILKIDTCDILIGIFWRRFGTLVSDAKSGTEHEFRIAYEAWKKSRKPQIIVYFSQKPYAPKSKEETDQWGLVLQFKKDFPPEGLWWEYKGKTEFEALLRNHLAQIVSEQSHLETPSNTLPKPVWSIPKSREIVRIEAYDHDSSVRILDAAMPSHVVKDQVTELQALIRLPESAGLIGALQNEEDEARPEDVRSKRFNMSFPTGPSGKLDPLKATVQLTSPDFSPRVQRKNLFIPPHGDSELCRFLMTPVRTGKLRVLVELHWEDAVRGSSSLRTQCVAQAESVPASSGMNVVSIELNANAGSAVKVAETTNTERASAEVTSPSARVAEEAPSRNNWNALRSPRVLLAIIAAVSTIMVGYWQYGLTKGPNKPVSNSALIFSGRVRDEDSKKTIANAKVSIAEDQGVPQVVRTDMDGIFHIQLSPTTQSLKITVDAEGYDSATKDANPHRTGPEEIYIHPVAAGKPHAAVARDNSDIAQGRKLLTEFDFRLSELDQKTGLIEQAQKPDDKGALLMYIWRAAHGDSAYQPTLPEFANTHWAGIVVQLSNLGASEHSREAIAAIRDLDTGVVTENGVALQSPGGYRLLPVDYLKERSKVLHQFSDSAWKQFDPSHN